MSCKITYYGETIDTIHEISYKRIQGIGIILIVGGLFFYSLSIPRRIFSKSDLPRGLVIPDPTADVITLPYDRPKLLTTSNQRSEEVVDVKKQIREYVCSKDWDCETAKRVVEAESSWNFWAIHHNKNGTWDFCGFQINSIHGYSREYLSDFRNCVDVAYQLYLERGFQPWRASIKKWK
jgi:hypothetical protein